MTGEKPPDANIVRDSLTRLEERLYHRVIMTGAFERMPKGIQEAIAEIRSSILSIRDVATRVVDNWIELDLIPVPEDPSMTICAVCPHFVEQDVNVDDTGYGRARWYHLDDGDKEHDHDAEPGETFRLSWWKENRADLFVVANGRLGPNAFHYDTNGRQVIAVRNREPDPEA